MEIFGTLVNNITNFKKKLILIPLIIKKDPKENFDNYARMRGPTEA